MANYKINQSMMRSIFFQILFIVSINSFAQYQEVENSPFIGVAEGTVTTLDADMDGDIDLVLTGSDFDNTKRTDLYINEGDLNFTLVSDIGIPGFEYTGICAGDVDGNGTDDIFATGLTGLAVPIAGLYLNDGTGAFTLSTETTFPPLILTSAEFFDADADGDLDLIYAGEDLQNARFTRLFINNGSGAFTEDSFAGLVGLGVGAIDIADVDDNGYEDILICGITTQNERMTLLYLNESGVFTATATDFPQINSAAIEFFDANGDDAIDVMLSGTSGPDYSDIYINNGSGGFTLQVGDNLVEVYNCNASHADVDNDGDMDLMINGIDQPNQICNLYLNDGTGAFPDGASSLYTGIPTQNGEIHFQDFDQDGDQEFFITGFSGVDGKVAALYTLGMPNGLSENARIDFEIYPNPSSALVNISVSTGIQADNIEILDVSGKEMLSTPYQQTVDVSGLKCGVYVIRFKKDGEVLSALKLTVQ